MDFTSNTPTAPYSLDSKVRGKEASNEQPDSPEIDSKLQALLEQQAAIQAQINNLMKQKKDQAPVQRVEEAEFKQEETTASTNQMDLASHSGHPEEFLKQNSSSVKDEIEPLAPPIPIAFTPDDDEAPPRLGAPQFPEYSSQSAFSSRSLPLSTSFIPDQILNPRPLHSSAAFYNTNAFFPPPSFGESALPLPPQPLPPSPPTEIIIDSPEEEPTNLLSAITQDPEPAPPEDLPPPPVPFSQIPEPYLSGSPFLSQTTSPPIFPEIGPLENEEFKSKLLPDARDFEGSPLPEVIPHKTKYSPTDPPSSLPEIPKPPLVLKPTKKPAMARQSFASHTIDRASTFSALASLPRLQSQIFDPLQDRANLEDFDEFDGDEGVKYRKKFKRQNKKPKKVLELATLNGQFLDDGTVLKPCQMGVDGVLATQPEEEHGGSEDLKCLNPIKVSASDLGLQASTSEAEADIIAKVALEEGIEDETLIKELGLKSFPTCQSQRDQVADDNRRSMMESVIALPSKVEPLPDFHESLTDFRSGLPFAPRWQPSPFSNILYSSYNTEAQIPFRIVVIDKRVPIRLNDYWVAPLELDPKENSEQAAEGMDQGDHLKIVQYRLFDYFQLIQRDQREQQQSTQPQKRRFNDCLDEFFRNDSRAFMKTIGFMLPCQVEFADHYSQKYTESKKEQKDSGTTAAKISNIDLMTGLPGDPIENGISFLGGKSETLEEEKNESFSSSIFHFGCLDPSSISAFSRLQRLTNGGSEYVATGSIDSFVRAEIYESLVMKYGEGFFRLPFFLNDRKADRAIYMATQKFFNKFFTREKKSIPGVYPQTEEEIRAGYKDPEDDPNLDIVYQGNKFTPADFIDLNELRDNACYTDIEAYYRLLEQRKAISKTGYAYESQFDQVKEPDMGWKFVSEVAEGMQEKMSSEQQEAFVDELLSHAEKYPRFMKMKWFNWNNNKALIDLFKKKIGIHQDNPIIRGKAKMWGRAKWIIHKDLSFARFNYQISMFICHYTDFISDPFTPKQNMMIYDKFLLRSILKCLKLWHLKRQVKLFGFDEPSSKTTFLSSADIDSNFDVVEALEDTRNETFGRLGRIIWLHNLHQSVYVTPRFLQHFDVHYISDPDVLQYYVQFMSAQLGFYCEKFATGDNEKKLSEWQGGIRFSCLMGQGNWYNKNGTDQVIEIQPCSFFVRYTRSDPDDIDSVYHLTGYSLTHTHELCLRLSLPVHQYGDGVAKPKNIRKKAQDLRQSKWR